LFDLSYSNDDYRKIYSLVTHETSRSAEDFFQRTIIATYLLDLLEEANYFNKDENNNQLEQKMWSITFSRFTDLL
jgi:hypothetical protein